MYVAFYLLQIYDLSNLPADQFYQQFDRLLTGTNIFVSPQKIIRKYAGIVALNVYKFQWKSINDNEKYANE